ncbi:MAG: hypothetical protein IJX84_05340 [Clostridia bacterium]|nr:hypothetical protein [Clostridia bacterium]
MTSIRLPRLMDSQLTELCRLEPTHLSIQLNMSLSTAAMTLPPQSPQVTAGQLVELYTQQGSAGIFRVQQVERDWNTATRISLAHTLVTLADTTIPGTGESRTLPAAQLFTELLAHQSLWQPGDVDVPVDVLFTIRAKDANLLESLTDLMAELPGYRLDFDQTVFPWKLHLRALSDTCATECRLTRNLRSLTIETDRSELCTRLYLPGMETPLEADTISQWGVVSRSLDASTDLTEQELTQRGQHYLDQHKNPQVTVTMDAADLSRLTGAALDSFRLGFPCRVCLPEGESLTQRIVSLTWPDVYGAPEQLRVTLANRSSNASTVLAGLIVDTTQVKKQITWQWDDLAAQKKLLIAAEESITLQAQDIELLAQKITAQAESIDLHAADILTLRSGIEDNTAAITLANGRIDAQASTIALKADKIDLEGYVTMEEFEAFEGSVSDLWADEFRTKYISVDSIVGGEADFDNIVFGTINGMNSDEWIKGVLEDADIATQSWTNSNFYSRTYCNANFATHTWATTNFPLKSAFTTATTKVCTGTQYTTATTPPFYNANGTQVSGGVTYVKSVTYNTTDLTYLVYA